MNVHKTRMLNVARALRESPNPQQFRMTSYGRAGEGRWGLFKYTPACGTPVCALGHYAHRSDLQRNFSLSTEGTLLYDETGIEYWDGAIRTHFGITKQEANDLFAKQGCDDAQTPQEAIYFIEQFAARKWPEIPAGAEAPEMKKLKESLA